MDSIISWLQGLPSAAVYAVVGLLVFAEDALFVGFVLPAETAVVVGGVLAQQGQVSVVWLAVIVVAAAVLGDSTGYEIGRKIGPHLLNVRVLQGHRGALDRATEFIRRRGPLAVFLGRFVAFFRAMMPALAGISRMPYRLFLPFNLMGGLVWGIGFVLLGYLAGAAYQRVEALVGRALAIVVAVLVVAAVVVWRVRRRRAERDDQGLDDQGLDG